MYIINTTTCSLKKDSNWNLYTKWSVINDKEILWNKRRKKLRDKLLSGDYSWIKKRLVQRTSE